MTEPYWEDEEVSLYHGNAANLHIAPEMVDLIVAAPPFWKAWDWDVPTVWLSNEPCAEEEYHQWVQGPPRVGRDKTPRLPHESCIKCYSWKGTLGTEPEPWEYAKHVSGIFTRLFPAMKPHGLLWLVMGDEYTADDDLAGIPGMVSRMMQPWHLRAEVIWERPNDDLDPRYKKRPVRSHETIYMFSKEPNHFYSQFQELAKDGITYKAGRTIWRFNKRMIKEGRFEGMPIELVERFITTGSREGGLVLDPFCGSGTTLEVARAYGRKAVGIELSPSTIQIAKNRLSKPWTKKIV